MSDPRPEPPAVTEAREAVRRFQTTTFVPVLGWLLLSSVVLLPAATKVLLPYGDVGTFGAITAWGVGLVGALGLLVTRGSALVAHQAVLKEWARFEVARKLGAEAPPGVVDPLDALVSGLAGKLSDDDLAAVEAARKRARELRGDATRAREAASALPSEGSGATALFEAAEAAEREASGLDEQVAGLVAQVMGLAPPARDAADRLAAASEVATASRDRALSAARSNARTNAREP